jgi:5-formyltetrahydrofolate cyclo-ligase
MQQAIRGQESIVTSKEDLRHRLRANRDKVPTSWRLLMARAANKRALPYFQGHQTIAVYNAIRSELDPILLIEALRARGATIVYPRVAKSSPVLEFCKVNVADAFQPGPFGLLEPSSDAELVSIADIDAFAVPALSFDREGNRLGWGKGHYDHTLAQNSRALRVGLCFQEQIESSLPHDSNDQSMDWVITDAIAFQGRDREASRDPRTSLPKVKS